MGLSSQIANIDHMQWSADPLDRLTELRGVREYIDVYIEQAVRECRANGVERFIDDVDGETREGAKATPIAWARIGEALGIARQTAWERYAHLLD